MAVFVLTPLSEFYLTQVQDAAPEVASLAKAGLLFLLPLPGMTVLVAWLRGSLIAYKFTRTVNEGMFINLGVTAALLVLMVWLRWPGLIAAATALNIALFIELLYLLWGVQH